MAADAWSTALTVLGEEAGLRLAEQQGLAARFLLREADTLREAMSSCFRTMLDDE
jgi:thiamine biosynthesis lipoprotein